MEPYNKVYYAKNHNALLKGFHHLKIVRIIKKTFIHKHSVILQCPLTRKALLPL